MTTAPMARSVIAAVAISALGGLASADEFDWPRMMVIATPGTMTASFASTNGWLPIFQREIGTVGRVVPEADEMMRYTRLTNRRDIQIASVSAAEMRAQVEGLGTYAAVPPASMRILWHHNDTPWGYVVRGDSPLTALEDIRTTPTRVAEGVFSPPLVAAVRTSLPGYLDMTPEEVSAQITYIPAVSYAENCRAVVTGRADVALCATVSSLLSEMEGTPGGIRWLPLDPDNTEGWARYLEGRPDLAPTIMDMGVESALGIGGSTSSFVYAVPADADEDLAYNMAKWLHENFESYRDTHPMSERMSLEVFRDYLNRTPLPIHDGTVRYLREIGEWTDEDDVWNAQAAANLDGWVAAREAAFAEARETGVTVANDDPAFVEILGRHTEGLEPLRSRL
ncbi:MAG: TAXI family TRAP transporter solute-binding subunit [Paracoccus sp. (in: a-proteobacteria)]|uniref:TAXI family TRAP transporter solute-binding subunit n=1 Tax=Paracoccus sp. TaxID=267 RepID=UPI00391E04BC